MPVAFTSIERVTHDEDSLPEARFCSTPSIAERVIAGWSLQENDLFPRDDDESKKRTGFTPRRVPHTHSKDVDPHRPSADNIVISQKR